MSALKAGTVCYAVGCEWAEVDGRVVTLTGRRTTSERGRLALEFVPTIIARGVELEAAEPEHLRPISDPDQPVDVTSDTDEPVTA